MNDTTNFNEALSLVAQGAAIPLLAVFVFYVAQKHNRLAIMWVSLVTAGTLALLCNSIILGLADLGHLDCGNDCSPEVTTYATLHLATAMAVILWVGILIYGSYVITIRQKNRK